MTEQKTKVPGQFFQWFDSLKQGYENSIHKLFNRVEQTNEEHKNQLKTVYQSQIDSLKKSYQDHLHSLKDNHQTQSEQTQNHIRQLEKDARFYQEQLQRQNQTIDKLNDRYDTVIFALKDKIDNKDLEKIIENITPQKPDSDQPSLHHASVETKQPKKADSTTEQTPINKAEQQPKDQVPASEPQVANDFIHQVSKKLSGKTTADNTPQSETPDKNAQQTTEPVDELQQAFDARHAQNFDEAYQLFLTAAQSGNEKAMGAIGRAHFVGEGVPLDKSTGLAWLIVAAEHDFEPARKKIDSAMVKSPDLYQAAWEISRELLRQALVQE